MLCDVIFSNKYTFKTGPYYFKADGMRVFSPSSLRALRKQPGCALRDPSSYYALPSSVYQDRFCCKNSLTRIPRPTGARGIAGGSGGRGAQRSQSPGRRAGAITGFRAALRYHRRNRTLWPGVTFVAAIATRLTTNCLYYRIKRAGATIRAVAHRDQSFSGSHNLLAVGSRFLPFVQHYIIIVEH